jgi:hypothetical protein
MVEVEWFPPRSRWQLLPALRSFQKEATPQTPLLPPPPHSM